jgi:hypothetical protein
LLRLRIAGSWWMSIGHWRNDTDVLRDKVFLYICELPKGGGRGGLSLKFRPVVFRCIRKIAENQLLASSCLSVPPSVRIEQLGSHWRDFHEIFRKSVEKIQGVISGFRDKVNENCVLLGHYAAKSGNILPTFRDNLFVPSTRFKDLAITQRVVVISYRRFEESISVPPMGCLETSV